MVRLLTPWATNTGKRLVRRPKLYLRDSGLLHALMSIETKYQDAPRMTSSMRAALADLGLTGLWVVYPGRTAYRLAENVWVVPLRDLRPTWDYGDEPVRT